MLLRNYGAIGFKRDNAQFNHAALYPFRNQRLHIRYEAGFIPGPACHIKLYPGLCQCAGYAFALPSSDSTPPLTTRVWQTHYARCIFFPFDCKGLEYLRCMYGACVELMGGALPCLLVWFAVFLLCYQSFALVCLPARGKGPSSLPCVRTSGARSQYTRTGRKVHNFLNKKRKKNNIMTILQKVIF